jgi:hypothetical protein
MQSDYPGFASATAKDGERIAKEQGARPRAKEQRGEVTGDDENAREGLAKPDQRKTDLNLVFSGARLGPPKWLSTIYRQPNSSKLASYSLIES